MIDHRDYCTITLNGRCNCRHGSKAGTSRTVDTEPRVTWLGEHRFVHPPSCAVYKHQGNWAPYCDCDIGKMAKVHNVEAVRVPAIDPADVPKEYQPVGWHFESRAPWWVWSFIGFAAGLPLGAWAGWPSW